MEIEIQEDMQQEPQHEQDPQQKPQKKEYILPDGFGLSLDEVSNLIHQKCNISISNDDPIMCIVPILNAFLSEQHKMNEDHAVAMEKVYQQVLEEFLKALDVKLEKGDFKINVEAQKENNRYLVLVLYCLVVILAVTLTIVFLWKF